MLWERAPTLEVLPGGDRKLWAVWAYVVAALVAQRRYPRRIAAADCDACRKAGYTA